MGSNSVNVLTGAFSVRSMAPCDLSNCTKEQIKQYFENTYDLYESLFVALKDQDAFYKYPERLRLPLIFYYGHTAAVYINKLILGDLLQPSERINLHLETLLETGVDEMSWDDTENYRLGGGKMTWPMLADVVDYRRQVREVILRVVDETPLELPVTYDSTWWPVFMGIEHERIHFETSAVLIHQLPVHMVQRPLGWQYGPTSAGSPVLENRMIRVPESAVTLGKPQDFPSYGWDIDYGNLDCSVPEFESSEFLITNRDFLAFIQDGGYTNQQLWTEEGWRWCEYRQARHPYFWLCGGDCKSTCGAELASYSHCKAAANLVDGDKEHTQDGSTQTPGEDSYRLRLMFDIIPVPWDWPVQVNYHEAKAFCTWKGPDYRLPSEAEHHAIRGTQGVLYDGNKANINMQYGSSTPVNLYLPNEHGFYDVHGNMWKWMEDHQNGLPGATTSVFYEDYSTPYYDGRHNVLLGGSWVTTGDGASEFIRNWFRRHFVLNAGFRIVRSVTSVPSVKVPIRLIQDQIYIQGVGVENNQVTLPRSVQYEAVRTASTQLQQETEEALTARLQQDWGLEPVCALVSVNMALAAADKYLAGARGRCMYMGCGTGQGAASLGARFDDVLAVDFNGRFIDTCLKLQTTGVLNVPCGRAITVPVDELANITFKQLNWLPNEVGSFNLVLSTILDRVINYKGWLIRMKEMVEPHGLLVIVSQQYGAKAVQAALRSGFELVEMQELPGPGDVKMTVWRHH